MGEMVSLFLPRGLFFSKDKVENRYNLTLDESRVINILRTSMIILVIYAHSLNFLGVANAREPGALRIVHKVLFAILQRGGGVAGLVLFYSISAILLFRKPFTFISNGKKKFFSLVVPYFLWNSFWIVVVYLIQLNTKFRAATLSGIAGLHGKPIDHWGLSNWVNAYIGLGDKWMPFLYPFWFVKDLIVLNLLAVIIKFVVDRFPIPSIIGLVLIVVFRPELYIVRYYSLVAFVIGYLIVKYKISLSAVKKVPYFILVFSLFVGYALSFVHKTYLLGFLIASIAMYMILLRLAFFAVGRKKICNWFMILSRFSFLAFAFHEYTISLISYCIEYFIPPSYTVRFLEFLFLPAFAILMCAGLYALLSKTNVMKTLTGGR